MKEECSLKQPRFGMLSILMVAYLFVWGYNNHYFTEDAIPAEKSINTVLFVLVILLLRYVLQKNVGMKRAYVFSFLYSLALCLGKQVYDTNSIQSLCKPVTCLSSVLFLIGFTVVLGSLLSLFFRWMEEYGSMPEQAKPWKFFTVKHPLLLFWSLFFILWLPCYIAYYPGSTGYDIDSQTMQATGQMPFSRHHPPLHTYFWKLCIWLGGQTGVNSKCFYSIASMLLLSFVFAKMIVFLIQQKTKNWIIILTFFFFAVNPVVALFSFNMTKDGIFCGFLILMLLQLSEFIESPQKFLHSWKACALLVISVLLGCLFRNNMVYVFMLCVPFFVIGFRKYWKRLLLLLVFPVLCFFFINGFVYDQLGVEKGSSAEMLSVPMQQICNVVVKKESSLTSKEKENISYFFTYDSIKKDYNPRFADDIKGMDINEEGSFQGDYYDAHKREFWNLWFHLLRKHPGEYVDAFLSLNLPYWYPDSATLDPYSARKYIETGGWRVTNNPFLEMITCFYEEVATFESFQNLPVVATVFAITTPLWVIVLGMFLTSLQKKKEKLLLFLPGLFLWLTYMAGPVSNFRYIFPIFCMYPFYVALAFDKNFIGGRYE